MKNKIALSSGTLHNYGLNRFFEMAQKAGFKYIEIIPDNRLDTQQPEYIKKLCKQYKLKVISLHAAMEFTTSWGDDPKVRLDRSIKLAKELGVKNLIAHPTIAYTPEFNVWFKKNVKRLTKKALPVKLLVENLTKGYSKFGTGEMVFENFEYEDFSRFENIILDTSHMATVRLDIVEVAEKLGNKIKQVHLSDSDYAMHRERPDSIADAHIIPGRGKLPLKEFLKTLKKIKYKGEIVIELEPSTVRAGESDAQIVRELRAGRLFVEKYWT